MNKVVTSAGLLALGAATVYGYDPEMTRARTGRPFTVAATVRGFYDDNSTGAPDKTFAPDPFTPGAVRVVKAPADSFGYEVSPSAYVNLPLEQTFIRAGYVYSLRYFEGRPDDKYDQTHEFNALLRHAFSARHDISVADSFTYSSEPTVLDRESIVTAPVRLRTDVTALRNRGSIDYNVSLTEVLGLGLGYVNTWYDYDDEGTGSRSAALDRLEHLFRGDLRYQVNPSLVGLVGYQFGLNSYTADELLYGTVKSDARDSYSHYIYVGADHDFSSKLRGSVRIGGQYTDYHESDETTLSPYADASLTYVYLPDSSVQVGVRHTRNATDLVSPDAKGRPTLDQETTAGFLQLSHRITRNLTGNLIGQIQHSTFNGGSLDDESENLYLVGINFDYRIDQHWSVEAGYNYDLLESDVKATGLLASGATRSIEVRSFDRNRVYIGVRASY